jgi:hypothetical protein
MVTVTALTAAKLLLSAESFSVNVTGPLVSDSRTTHSAAPFDEDVTPSVTEFADEAATADASVRSAISTHTQDCRGS